MYNVAQSTKGANLFGGWCTGAAVVNGGSVDEAHDEKRQTDGH